jgi:hypothetical protein
MAGGRDEASKKTGQRSKCLVAAGSSDDVSDGDPASTTDPRPSPVQRLYVLPPPELPKFNGDGDVEAFAAAALRYLACSSMDTGTAIEWLLSALEGCAREEVLQRMDTGIDRPQDILSVLLDTFRVQRSIAVLQRDFYNSRQSTGESLLTFAHGLQTQLQRINSQRPGCISDDMLRDQFIEGVTSRDLRRELRRFLRAHPEASFISMRAEAQRWLQEEEKEEPQAAVQQTIVTPQADVQALQEQISALTRQIEELQGNDVPPLLRRRQ